MGSPLNDTFLELLNILISSNCPLISRTDHWWIEELLFKPGKPRTDLIVWTISRLTNSMYPSEIDNDSTATSSGFNNFKIPESDEGKTNDIESSVAQLPGERFRNVLLVFHQFLCLVSC